MKRKTCIKMCLSFAKVDRKLTVETQTKNRKMRPEKYALNEHVH